jgi:membrane fusion protein, multidrug efflux system
MNRKLILAGLGILLIAIAVFIANNLVSASKTTQVTAEKTIKSVFAKEAKNQTLGIKLSSNGRLTAQRRVELFSEVQGILLLKDRAFRAGQIYQKNDTIIAIDDTEFKASVQSAKSNFLNALSTTLADIALDFPEVYEKWNAYVKRVNIHLSVPKLPDFESEKERFFISGRGIVNNYYTVVNLETRLSKYVIIAPFTGALSATAVTEGTLVRSGQNLGTFIENGRYEIEIPVAATYASFLAIGKPVQLTTLDRVNQYDGRVVRINPAIDQETQMISVFVYVVDVELKEGQYLKTELEVRSVEDAVEIDRSLLLDSQEIFVIRDGALQLIKVTPIHFNENTVIVQGVLDGEQMLAKPLPGAQKNMPVTVIAP